MESYVQSCNFWHAVPPQYLLGSESDPPSDLPAMRTSWIHSPYLRQKPKEHHSIAVPNHPAADKPWHDFRLANHPDWLKMLVPWPYHVQQCHDRLESSLKGCAHATMVPKTKCVHGRAVDHKTLAPIESCWRRQKSHVLHGSGSTAYWLISGSSTCTKSTQISQSSALKPKSTHLNLNFNFQHLSPHMACAPNIPRANILRRVARLSTTPLIWVWWCASSLRLQLIH